MTTTSGTRGRTRLAALVAAAGVVLAGCAAEPTVTSPAPVPSDPVTLKFWHSAEGATAESLDAIVKDFNDAHVGKITVEAAYQGSYDDTVAKLSAAVQGGSLPNLVQINDVNTAFMVDSGLVAPAQEAITAAGVDYSADRLAPAVANYYSVDGVLWSMPFQVSQPAVMVRADALEATGITAEAFPRTVTELAAWAQQVKATSGKAGISFHLNPWWFEQLTAAAGVAYCTPENGRGGVRAEAFTLTDPAQLVQWSALQPLFADGAALNVGTDFSAAVNGLASGEVAAIFASSGALGTVTKAMTTDFVVVPFPIDSPDGGVVPGGNSVFLLDEPSSEAQQAAGAEFLAYLGSDQVQSDVFAATGFLPTTLAALDAAKASANPHQAALLAQLAATTDSIASAGCRSGALQGVRGEVGPAIEKVVGGADIATTFASAEQAAAAVVADYNARAGR